MDDGEDLEFYYDKTMLLVLPIFTIGFGIFMFSRIGSELGIRFLSWWIPAGILVTGLYYHFQAKQYLKLDVQGFMFRNYQVNKTFLWTDVDEYLLEFKHKERASSDLLTAALDVVEMRNDAKNQIGVLHLKFVADGKNYKSNFPNVKYDRTEKVVKKITQGFSKEPSFESKNPENIYNSKWRWSVRRSD